MLHSAGMFPPKFLMWLVSYVRASTLFSLSLRSLRLVLLLALFPFQTLEFLVRIRSWSLRLLRLISEALLTHTSASSLPLLFKIYLFPFYMYGVFCLHVCLCTVCLSDTCGGQKEASYPLGCVDSREIPCGCSDPLEEQPVLLQLELNWGKVVREEHSVPYLCGRGLWVHCCG